MVRSYDLPAVNLQEANGILQLPGADLNRNTDSISFPVSILFSILKQQFSAICLCYVLG